MPENNVSALEAAEKDRSRGVIAATAIDGGDCATLPTRIVLRDLGSEYVTHLEVFTRDGKHNGFCWGHYFNYPHQFKNKEAAEKKAIEDATERAREKDYKYTSFAMQVYEYNCETMECEQEVRDEAMAAEQHEADHY
jgi:hypothetical protein